MKRLIWAKLAFFSGLLSGCSVDIVGTLSSASLEATSELFHAVSDGSFQAFTGGALPVTYTADFGTIDSSGKYTPGSLGSSASRTAVLTAADSAGSVKTLNITLYQPGKSDRTFSSTATAVIATGMNGAVGVVAGDANDFFVLHNDGSVVRIARVSAGHYAVDGSFSLQSMGNYPNMTAVVAQKILKTPDGGILLAGNLTTTGTTGEGRAYFVKYKADGTYDESFGEVAQPGRAFAGAVLGFGNVDIMDAEFGTDGSLYVVAAQGTSNAVLFKLGSDGAFDLTFGPTSSGKNVFASGTVVNGAGIVRIGSDNVFSVGVGMGPYLTSVAGVFQFNSSGISTAVYPAGNVFPPTTTIASISDLILDPQGLPVVLGVGTPTTDLFSYWSRLTAEGDFDTDYAASGIGSMNLYVGTTDPLLIGRFNARGNLILCSRAESDAIFRLDADAALDGTFGSGGRTESVFGAGGSCRDLVIDSSRRITAAVNNGSNAGYLLRYWD